SKADQSDLHWYAASASGGKYTAAIRLANHQYNTGQYIVHAYVTGANGVSSCVKGATFAVASPVTVTAADTVGTERSIALSAAGIEALCPAGEVRFAVWSDAGGQDDLIWYAGTKSGNRWIASADVAKHRTAGKYQVHAYAIVGGSGVFAGATTFSIRANAAETLTVAAQGGGSHRAELTGVGAPSGLGRVQFAVWSKADQSDLHWYAASASGGKYTAAIRLANHQYNTGQYIVHAYVTGANGVSSCVKGATFTAALPSEMTTFYVSPTGDDANLGTLESPLKSIDRAKAAVRAVSVSQKSDLTVILRGGRYTQSKTLVFDENDSGKNGYKVTYTNYPGETVSVSGGVRISGWEETQDGVWKANTSLGAMRQLYVNDVRAVLARSSSVPYQITGYGSGRKAFTVRAEDVEGISGGEICTYMDWKFSVLPIESITAVQGNDDLKTVRPKTFAADVMQYYGTLLDFNCRYFLQNDKSLLDEPGEFWFDRNERAVYYIPREGEDMADAAAYAPGVGRLVEIAGSAPQTHARNLIFKGLTFEYSGFDTFTDKGLLEYQANHFYTEDAGSEHSPMDLPSGTIHVENADNIRLESCVIRHSGGAGINLYPSVSESAIDGCVVTDIAGNGVTVSPFCSNQYTSEELFTPADPALTGVHDIDVTNNVITWTGQEFKASCALANILGYRILMRNNEIAFAPYTGISNGWGWSQNDYVVRENTIAYNDIHHIGMSSVDTAGYYNLNAQRGTQILGNYIHDIQKAGTGRAGAPVYPIYLDEGSDHLVVTGNSIRNCPENPQNILYHNTGDQIYAADNGYAEATVAKAGVGEAYRGISLKQYNPAGSSLVRNISLGQPAKRFDGEVGMRFTAAKNATVTALGRFYLAGNTGVHRLTLHDASGNIIAQTSVDMSGDDVDYNGFQYAALADSVQLAAGQSYYLTSEEKSDGDLFLGSACKVISDNNFTVTGSVSKALLGGFVTEPTGDRTAGPVNLLFEN
ncbi:MAG: GBS Bsp-like repeat-containing protein, partial [Clostridiales Family XIII bacterium]|nr:GBS Bsp-like repeat-containing protein [Clostridiales Family XIII bacterium]